MSNLRLDSGSIQKTTISSKCSPLLILLVTPNHINFLDQKSKAISTLLGQVFHAPKDGQNLDVVAAVVDQIPYSVTGGESTEQSTRQKSTENAPSRLSLGNGDEGVSFFVLDSSTVAAPDLWSNQSQSEEDDSTSIQQRCTLSFVLSPVMRTLQLPVANTLFQNGKTATVIAQRWRAKEDPNSTFMMSCIREHPLSQQIIRMSDAFRVHSGGLHQRIISSLLPVTPPRKITAAVGNIIRKLDVKSASSESRPASEELEKAISDALKEGRIPAQTAGIWALVRPSPSSITSVRGAHLMPEIEEASDIQEAILNGCRLHKVLSGGGGWGEKQGLLALDPDSTYDSARKTYDELSLDSNSGKLQALGGIVCPGDTVRFYIYQQPPTSQVAPTPELGQEASELGANLSMTFGTLPSTMDSVPDVTSKQARRNSQASCTAIKNHFGMLSEHGMSIQSKFTGTNLQETTIVTKLDAPHTTFSIQEGAHIVDAGHAAHCEPQEPTKAKVNRVKPPKEALPMEASTSLEEFRDALDSMPSHRYLGTPYQRDQGYSPLESDQAKDRVLVRKCNSGSREVVRKVIFNNRQRTAEKVLKNTLRPLVRLRKHKAKDPTGRGKSAVTSKAKQVLNVPKIRFIRQSKDSSFIDEVRSTAQEAAVKQPAATHGMRLNVRKHLSVAEPAKASLDTRPRYDKKLEAFEKPSLRQKTPQNVETGCLIRKDATHDDSEMLRIRYNYSQEAAPADSRDGARRLYRAYSLPLLNPSSYVAPKP
ncbi:hypothetical protein ACLMJK_006612 [Lecanora helva]